MKEGVPKSLDSRTDAGKGSKERILETHLGEHVELSHSRSEHVGDTAAGAAS